VKTAEAGGPRGYDAGKKIEGRKRHAPAFAEPSLVATGGRGLEPEAHPASVQDRDGAPPVLKVTQAHFQFIQKCSPAAFVPVERSQNA
jgi:hypothetical protein